MERERHDQLRQILALQILPELKELRRRQTALQTTIWVGLVFLLSGMAILLGLMGVLIGR